MALRFQADADLNQIIVSAVLRRVPDIEFKTATAAGLAGLADREVLARAAHEGRILVTHDQTTMPRHFGEFVQEQRSPGYSSFHSILRFDIRERLDSDLDGNRGRRVGQSSCFPTDLNS